MSRVLAGLAAGFVATLVLSALMVMKAAIGLMPELDIARMLGTMLGAGPSWGWAGHLFIGTVLWGLLFAWLEPRLPGSRPWIRGVAFGLGAWLLMTVLVMPMAGAGLFGLRLGIMAPIMTALLHAIFGAVLGATFASLAGPGRIEIAAQRIGGRPGRTMTGSTPDNRPSP